MEYLQFVLIIATLLCSLVAGFLFAFAVVVMPGIGRLSNSEFIRAFQVIDGVIQDNQPVFMVVWLGSIIALIVAAAFGVLHMDGIERWLLIISALAYVLGVQLPTVTINIPLNNKLQSLDVETMGESEQQSARELFEGQWNRWNVIRTAISCVVSLLLMVSLVNY